MSIVSWFCWGIWRRLIGRPRHGGQLGGCNRPPEGRGLACVGLVVMAGSLLLVMAPDTEPPAPVRGEPMTVVIDAGHGGRDAGARSRGLVEKELTLDVALRVERILTAKGVHAVLTRDTDTRLALAQRAGIANSSGAEIFVSIHFNQSPYGAAQGVEVFYAPQKILEPWAWIGFFSPLPLDETQSGQALARCLQAALVDGLAVRNRGIRSRALYVVRHVRGPAVLIEAGFMSSPLEARLLAGAEYRERLAGAIAEGVLQYRAEKNPDSGLPQLATKAK